jgi:dTDP-4-dehydrorhamnose 3,5-epimerase-like enzyme
MKICLYIPHGFMQKIYQYDYKIVFILMVPNCYWWNKKSNKKLDEIIINWLSQYSIQWWVNALNHKAFK